MADCPLLGSPEWHEMQQVPYRECVGRLTNISRTTRPDICYVVGQVNRFLHNPGRTHWNAVKRIMRYLLTDPSLAFTLSPFSDGTPSLSTSVSLDLVTGPLRYHGNVDADFAQRDDGRVSASFLVVLLSPGLLKASLPLLHLLPMLNTLLSITLYVRLSGAGLSFRK